MIEHSLIVRWWSVIQGMETNALEENASSLGQLHNCDHILDLPPLPGLQFPDIPSSDIFSRKPAFKHLHLSDILFLRKCLFTKEFIPELSEWAETLLRYLEINRSSIIKRTISQFGSVQSGQIALLELTAFMLDVYFIWDDLRYLNLIMKLMDMPGIFSLKIISKNISSNNQNIKVRLMQVRLMILRKAAIEKILQS